MVFSVQNEKLFIQKKQLVFFLNQGSHIQLCANFNTDGLSHTLLQDLLNRVAYGKSGNVIVNLFLLPENCKRHSRSWLKVALVEVLSDNCTCQLTIWNECNSNMVSMNECILVIKFTYNQILLVVNINPVDLKEIVI